MRFWIDLQIEEIQDFIKITEKYDVPIDAKNNNSYRSVSAKSILGIMSLNLTEPIEIKLDDVEAYELLKEELKEYLI